MLALTQNHLVATITTGFSTITAIKASPGMMGGIGGNIWGQLFHSEALMHQSTESGKKEGLERVG